MNLIELENNLEMLESVVRLDESKFKILSISDYYDGPISGLLKLNKKKYIYEMINKEILGFEFSNTKRVYAVIKLNPIQKLKERQIQFDFLKYVGEFGIIAPFFRPIITKRSNKEKFYEKHAKYLNSRPYD